jgi:hypothetical protein
VTPEGLVVPNVLEVPLPDPSEVVAGAVTPGLATAGLVVDVPAVGPPTAPPDTRPPGPVPTPPTPWILLVSQSALVATFVFPGTGFEAQPTSLPLRSIFKTLCKGGGESFQAQPAASPSRARNPPKAMERRPVLKDRKLRFTPQPRCLPKSRNGV